MFTLPAPIADIAYQNKAVIYDLLFKAAAETTLTIAADPKHLGARIGITAVLHTWGSAMTHHPHVHMIVPGGGLSDDGERWIACHSARLPFEGRFAPAVETRLIRLDAHEDPVAHLGIHDTSRHRGDLHAAAPTLPTII